MEERELKQVRREDFDVLALMTAAREGRLYVDETIKAVSREAAVAEVRAYAARIRALATRKCSSLVNEMWELIQAEDELVNFLKPNPEGYGNDSPVGIRNNQQEEAEPNRFVPKKQLQVLLGQEWFAEVRTDAKYDAAWTDRFVEALMQSEHGEDIARQWAVTGPREKKMQLKGYLVGLLRDAGVIRGSYDAIARAMGISDQKRRFSRYMASGKSQLYAEWVEEWVRMG